MSNNIEQQLQAAMNAAETPAQKNARKRPVCGPINAEVSSSTVKQGKGPSKMKAGLMLELLPILASTEWVGKSQTRNRTKEEIMALATEAVKAGELDQTDFLAVGKFVTDNQQVTTSGGVHTLAEWGEKAPDAELYFTLGGVKEAIAGLLRDALAYAGEE